MKRFFILCLLVCLGCKQKTNSDATPVSPEPPATAKPAAPTKPGPPAPAPTPDPKEVEPPEDESPAEPMRWVYPTAEMFEGDAPSEAAIDRLEALRAKITSDSMTVRITAHTDTRGSGAYNLKTSELRAQALQAALTKDREDLVERVEAVGRGEEVAPVDGEPASRVVIELMP